MSLTSAKPLSSALGIGAIFGSVCQSSSAHAGAAMATINAKASVSRLYMAFLLSGDGVLTISPLLCDHSAAHCREPSRREQTVCSIIRLPVEAVNMHEVRSLRTILLRGTFGELLTPATRPTTPGPP